MAAKSKQKEQAGEAQAAASPRLKPSSFINMALPAPLHYTSQQ
jgi:hypothetical protein